MPDGMNDATSESTEAAEPLTEGTPSAAGPGLEPGTEAQAEASSAQTAAEAPAADVSDSDAAALEGAAADLAAERLADLQRLQAEFVNYKRRVERDRDVAKTSAIASVLEAVLPVLDDIYAARNAGDLVEGPFAAIAEKLESTLGRFDLERYGDQGDEFDPAVHEALVHTAAPEGMEVTTTTVVQILQPGYRCADRVLRPARVAVADPS